MGSVEQHVTRRMLMHSDAFGEAVMVDIGLSGGKRYGIDYYCAMLCIPGSSPSTAINSVTIHLLTPPVAIHGLGDL